MSAITASTPHRTVTRRFVLHYLEMVAVMFAGMGALMLPSTWALGAVGTGWAELRADAPAAMLLWMAVIMVVPMAGWMAFRGHSARANVEMAASMVVPTLALVAAMGAGLVADVGIALVLEHVLMLGGMLVAMLARPAEYSHHAH
jgi:hypothetical protein